MPIASTVWWASICRSPLASTSMSIRPLPVICVSRVLRVTSACRMTVGCKTLNRKGMIPFRLAFTPFHGIPMSRFWSQVVRDLTPYVPGEQPKIANLIKLNTNENPYPPSPKALAAIQAELGTDAARLRLYPDPNADLLKAAVAKRHGVTAQHVFVGNGSDEVVAHVFMALLKHEAPILFPDITYSFYPVYCGLYGVDYITVPLAEDFTINPDDYTGKMWNGEDCGGIIFPNPT